MKKFILKLSILIFAITISGCAASYTPINPKTVNYNSHDSQDGLELSYRYDVLRERTNKKYAKKEDKSGIKLIAVKITNNTNSIIHVGKDVAFYSGQNKLSLMEPHVIKESLKQMVPGYLPYFLLTFVNLYVVDGHSVETYRIGLILGPSITIGNMVLASKANKSMLNELLIYDIQNKDIQIGETVYGIIGVRNTGYSAISLRKIE